MILDMGSMAGMMADMDMVRDRSIGSSESRMPPLYDLECLRQHPHLARGFSVSDCEDAQALGDRAGCPVGSIRRGGIRIGRCPQTLSETGSLSQRDCEG